MNPHLHSLVCAEIHLRILVYASCVAGLNTLESHLKRLLVELCGLGRTGILIAGHAGGEHIVDRLPAGVLLNVHNTHVEVAFGRRVVARVEVELVVTPFAAHKLKCGETQVRHLLESCHEHTGETHCREVADSSDNLVG